MLRYRSATGNATLYLSRFASDEGADSLLNEMSESIGEGRGEFAHHARFEAGNSEIHVVLGQDQIHFFFARENELAWLGIDPALARPGLAQVLGLAEEDLSDRIMMYGMKAPPATGSSDMGGAAGSAGSDPEEDE